MSADGAVEGGTIIVVTAADGGTLVDLLASRGRPTRVISSAADLPSSVDGVRALAVLSGNDEVLAAVEELVAEGHAADVPIVVVGAAAGIVGAAVGVQFQAAGDRGPVVNVDLSEAAEQDAMMAPTPSGVDWIGTGRLAVSGDAVVLAVAGQAPVVAVAGRTYVVALDVELDDAAIDALIEQEQVTEAARPFLKAHGAALLGRWVDLVVGRTEEEMPWGRRGPQPVAAPGLSLNPA